jgi:hypothetical protein
LIEHLRQPKLLSEVARPGRGPWQTLSKTSPSGRCHIPRPAVLPATAGDSLQFRVDFTRPACKAIRANSRSWLAIEIVETSGAADPPADITGFMASRPGASELLRRLRVARRIGFNTDLARSQGRAGTATFIAAAEAILETGDVLSVIASTAPDATLADVGFTIAGTQVLWAASCRATDPLAATGGNDRKDRHEADSGQPLDYRWHDSHGAVEVPRRVLRPANPAITSRGSSLGCGDGSMRRRKASAQPRWSISAFSSTPSSRLQTVSQWPRGA